MPIFSGLLGAAAMGQQGTNAGQMQAVELAQMLEQIRNRRAEMALQGILPQGATLEPGQAPRVPSSNPAPAPLPPPPPSMARRPDDTPPVASTAPAPTAPHAPSPSLEEALGAPPPNINLGPGMPRIEGAATAAGQRRAEILGQIRIAQAERAQKIKDLIAAGVPEAIAPAAVENPQLLEHLQGGPFAKPPTYNKDLAITQRTQELVRQGMPLEKANLQARLEHGETNPRPPSNPVTVNTGQPFQDKAGNLWFPKTDKQGNVSWVQGQPGLSKIPTGKGGTSSADAMEKNAQLKRMSDASNMAVQLLPELEGLVKTGGIRPAIVAMNPSHPKTLGFFTTSSEKLFLKKMREMETALFHYEAPRGSEPTPQALAEIGQRYFGNVGDDPGAIAEGMAMLRRDVMRRQQTNPGAGVIGGGDGTMGGQKESITKAEAAQLRRLGHSDADINAKYIIQ